MKPNRKWVAWLSVALFATGGSAKEARIAPAVREAIARAGEAHVLIELRVRPVPKKAASYRLEIALVQADVLKALGGHFDLRYRYRTAPGISGVLRAPGLRALEQHPQVERCVLDQPGSGGLLQSVPAIQADRVHDLGFSGRGVVVGVLDSGVNLDHADLKEDIVHQYHFLNSGGNVGPGAMDEHGHGTNVAGIVTSDGTLAPKGVAPAAKIVAIRVLDRNNRGWLSDWMAGIDYIVANNDSLNVRIINMSLVSDAHYTGQDCDEAQSLFAAVANSASTAGILIVASSGNTGSSVSMSAPACLSDVVAVGAVYDSDLGREPNTGTYRSLFGGSWPDCADATTSVETLTCFTDRTQSLALVAPGAIITSTGLNARVSTFRGTSQAAPHVAGVAALLLEKNPNLTPEELQAALTNTSVRVTDPVNGRTYPLLNALEAIEQVTAVAGTPARVPQTFSLTQNYPNPVSRHGSPVAQTVIRYKLTQPQYVTLTLYDVRGRVVRELAQGFQLPGAYRVTLASGRLPAGVYLYRLRAGGASAVRKMVVLP